jgi:hypothetical protein
MKKYNLMNMGAMILLVLSLISFTSALSVSRDYLENNQLNMTLGETRNVQFVLQNGGATEPINVKVSILEGSELIKLVDASNIYLINPGTQVPVNFQVSVPEGVDFGQTYQIRIEFDEASLNQDAVSIGTGIEQGFKVFLAKTPAELKKDKQMKNLILIIGILLILIILVLIIIKVKKNRN